MGGTYRAWDGSERHWPPPNGWYRASDGSWWAPGTGPNPPPRRSVDPPPVVRLNQVPTPITDEFAARRGLVATADLFVIEGVSTSPGDAESGLITRIAVVAAGVALAVLTGVGAFAILLATGQLDDLVALRPGDRSTSTDADLIRRPATSFAVAEPPTAAPSEPRADQDAPANQAWFPDLIGIDQATDVSRSDDDPDSVLGG